MFRFLSFSIFYLCWPFFLTNSTVRDGCRPQRVRIVRCRPTAKLIDLVERCAVLHKSPLCHSVFFCCSFNFVLLEIRFCKLFKPTVGFKQLDSGSVLGALDAQNLVQYLRCCYTGLNMKNTGCNVVRWCSKYLCLMFTASNYSCTKCFRYLHMCTIHRTLKIC